MGLREECDNLAEVLGVTFKASKDEGLHPDHPKKAIDWIGFTVDTTGNEVTIRPQEEKRTSII